jgi:hypothetical protein
MRTVKTVSAFVLFITGITALLYFFYFESGSSSPQKRPGVAAVIETRSTNADQYPSVNDLRQNNGTLQKQSDAMTASDRKMMMYAIKTIHDPFNNAQ